MSVSIIKNSFYSILKTVASLIFPVISFAYASRILLPDGMGKISFSKSFVVYFTLIAMLGIQNHGIRECAAVRDDKASLSRTAREIFAINICSVIVSYALFFVVINTVDSLAPYRELLLINSLSIGLTALGMEWLYNAMEDYRYIAVRTCVVQLAAMICMLIFVRTAEDIDKYAMIQVISGGGAFLFNFIHSGKYIDRKTKYDLHLKRHLKPVFALFIMSALVQVFTVMDSTMLGFMTNDTAVGLYSASHKISDIAFSAVCSVTLVLTPRIAYYAERDMHEEVKRVAVRAINCVFMLCIPSAMGLFVLSRPIILIFSGEAFAEADITSKIISLRNLIVPVNMFIVSHFFVPLKKDRLSLASTAAAAAVNFLLNLILIPQFIQNGAAIATVAAELIELIINFYFLSGIIPLKLVFRDIRQYVFAAAFIIPVCLLLSLLEMNMIIYLLLSVVSAVIIYFGVLIALKNSFVAEGLDILKSKLKK
ncbi:MAG: flippase [Oscillospiraceae bacterium]|nr:flippase [Oscillospiraceae bacterium]